MFALGLLVTAAYWPGILSPAAVPKWAALSILAPGLLLYRQQSVPFTTAHLVGICLILWCALTILWSVSPFDSIGALWQIAFLPAICFCLGSQDQSLRPLFIGAGVGMAISSAVAIAQLAGWVDWPSINVPSGLFLNKNFMAEAAALVLIWLVAERVWWLVALVAPAIALTDARGALLGLGLGLLLLFRQRRDWATGALLAAVTTLFAHAMLVHGTATIAARGDIWADATDGIGIFGNGLGTFGVNQLQSDASHSHAHNDALELTSDLGLIGLGLAVLFVRELLGSLNPARLVLIVFAVEGCFAFPLYLPTTLAIAALAAGGAVRDRVVVRHIVRGGRNFGVTRMGAA
jgi:hypothetical protein